MKMKKFGVLVIVCVLIATATASGATAGLINDLTGEVKSKALRLETSAYVAYVGQEVIFTVTSWGTPVEGVTVKIRDSSDVTLITMAATDSNGQAAVVFEKAGQYDVEAFKQNYRDAIPLRMTLLPSALIVNAPAKEYEGEEVTIVIKDISGKLVSEATVVITDSNDHIVLTGLTDVNGAISTVFDEKGIYTITAEKEYYEPGTAEIEILPLELHIKAPKQIYVMKSFEIVITDNLDRPVSDATVLITTELGTSTTELTDSNGRVSFAFPVGEHGVATITASKNDYEDATATINVLPRALSVEVKESAVVGEVVIIVVKDNFGETVEGATVYIEDANGVTTYIGDTDANGEMTYAFNRIGDHSVGAMKEGYVKATPASICIS